MARFVYVNALAKLMADHAPHAWCKLAILGAIYTGRIQLYSATATFRAYLPRYFLDPDGRLPERRGHKRESVAERYGLDLSTIKTEEDTEIWDDSWADDPKLIALGWVIFAEPWDWDRPSLSYEFFEIPDDFSGLFGFDDLHAEGEPDTALTYEGTFGGLCLSIADAESIAPMCNLEDHAFGSKTPAPTKSIGRPKRSGLESADEPLVRQMLKDRKADPSLSGRALAEKYVDEAAGHGTRDSKLKRLERRLADYGY